MSTACSFCPPGSYQTGTGSVDGSTCTICSAGTYQSGIGMILNANCTQCKPGTYQSGLGQVENSCLLCSIGQYQSGLGLTAQDSCISCNPGSYASEPGLSACTSCQSGKFQTDSSATICSPCPFDTYGLSSGQKNVSGCQLCPWGSTTNGLSAQNDLSACICTLQFYQNRKNPEPTCEICPRGALCTIDYSCALRNFPALLCPDSQPIIGNWSLSPVSGKYTLLDCPLGYSMQSTSKTGSEILLECLPCGLDQYILRPNQDDCQNCPPGLNCSKDMVTPKLGLSTWAKNGSTYVLTSCPTGYKIKSSGPNGGFDAAYQQCQVCSAGEECITQSCKGCQPCPQGTFKTSEGAFSCQTCPQGTYQPRFSSVSELDCIFCPSGTYSTGIGLIEATQCSLCEQGKYQDGVGRTSESACELCPPGKYSPILGASCARACIECPAGTYSLSSGGVNVSSCVLCLQGKYSSTSGANTSEFCLNCPQDQYNPSPGSVSCSACPEYSSTNGKTGQVSKQSCLCNPELYHVDSDENSNMKCQTCPKGAVCSDRKCALQNPPYFNCSNGRNIVGNWYYNPKNGQYLLESCPSGYSAQTIQKLGLAELQECKPCNSAEYILNPNSDDCQSCSLGLTCRGDATVQPTTAGAIWKTNRNIYVLHSCPKGYQVASTGLSGVVDATAQECQPCREGTECVDESCVECRACPAGKYKDLQSVSPCLPCEADTYSSVVGSKTHGDCKACPDKATTSGLSGQGNASACVCGPQYYHAASACQTCPKGAVCPSDYTCALRRAPSIQCADGSSIVGNWSVNGVSRLFELVGCPAGYSLVSAVAAGSKDLQECRPCQLGQYILSPSTDVCQVGPLGLTCEGNAVVTPKLSGSVWMRSGSIYVLHSCPKGYQVVSTGLSGAFDATAQECQPCREGTECVDESCVECRACPAGKYKDLQSVSPCLPCEADTYSSVVGSKTHGDCKACPDKATTSGLSGQGNASACVCALHFYSAGSSCISCPLDAVCWNNSVLPIVQGSTWSVKKGVWTLISCPAGFFFSNDQCRSCPISSFCIGGTSFSSSCGSGHYSPPESRSSADCIKAVFVFLTINLRILRGDFYGSTENMFQLAVSKLARKNLSYITIMTVSQGDDGLSTNITASIFTPNASDAAALALSIQQRILNETMTLYFFNEPTLVSVQVTECLPGYEISDTPAGICNECAANFFCVGGSIRSLPCPAGYFSPPGSYDPDSCRKTWFVELVAMLQNSSAGIYHINDVAFETSFRLALSLTTNMEAKRIIIVRISTRRLAKVSETKLTAEIAVDDETAAVTVQDRLNETSLNRNLALCSINPVKIQSVSVYGGTLTVQYNRTTTAGTTSIPFVIGVSLACSLALTFVCVSAISYLMRLSDSSRRSITLKNLFDLIELIGKESGHSHLTITSEDIKIFFIEKKINPKQRYQRFYSTRKPDIALTYEWRQNFGEIMSFLKWASKHSKRRHDCEWSKLNLDHDGESNCESHSAFIQQPNEGQPSSSAHTATPTLGIDMPTLWIDILFNNQNNEKEIKNELKNAEMIYKDAEFHFALRSLTMPKKSECRVQEHALNIPLEETNESVAAASLRLLTRGWCLYELFTRKCAAKKFHFLLMDDQNPSELFESVQHDLNKCLFFDDMQTGVPADKEQIQEKIKIVYKPKWFDEVIKEAVAEAVKEALNGAAGQPEFLAQAETNITSHIESDAIQIIQSSSYDDWLDSVPRTQGTARAHFSAVKKRNSAYVVLPGMMQRHSISDSTNSEFTQV